MLSLLFDPATVETLLNGWPDKPSLHRIPTGSPLPDLISADKIHDYLATGCVPAADVNIVRDAQARHPSSYTTAAGRLHPDKTSAWQQSGHTVQLRNLDRWYPPAAAIVAGIQQQTGCTGYISAFVTPAGEQGLQHHWDQHLGIIVQLEGVKTWELWAPVVTDPTRDYLESTGVPAEQWTRMLNGWLATGPDLTHTLHPGDVLVLPRGWIHNPHSRASTGRSTHITVVVRERTPLWIAEALTHAAITDPAMRAVIAPADLDGPALTTQVHRARRLLTGWLNTVDPETFADVLRRSAVTDREP